MAADRNRVLAQHELLAPRGGVDLQVGPVHVNKASAVGAGGKPLGGAVAPATFPPELGGVNLADFMPYVQFLQRIMRRSRSRFRRLCSGCGVAGGTAVAKAYNSLADDSKAMKHMRRRERSAIL
jgi:hypothetical protein